MKFGTLGLDLLLRQGHLRLKYQKNFPLIIIKISVDVQNLNIEIVLSDYKGFNSENLASLALTLCHA